MKSLSWLISIIALLVGYNIDDNSALWYIILTMLMVDIPITLSLDNTIKEFKPLPIQKEIISLLKGTLKDFILKETDELLGQNYKIKKTADILNQAQDLRAPKKLLSIQLFMNRFVWTVGLLYVSITGLAKWL